MNSSRINILSCLLACCLLSGCRIDLGYSDADLETKEVALDLGVKNFLHVNLNTANYQQSTAFYKALGFSVVLEVEESVSIENSVALDLPPYEIHALTFFLNGSFIDLIQWLDPFDPSPSYRNLNHLGLISIALETTELDSDIALLQLNGAELLSSPLTVERYNKNIRFVFIKDAFGVPIELFEVVDDEAQAEVGESAIE